MRLAITQFGLLMLMLVSPVSGWAALSLNVSPYDGGNSLRLGRVDDQTASSKEVRIRINSGDGKQYQVFQRLAQGLVSERGESLRADTLKTYSLLGSNSQGTLYQQDLGSLGAAEQLLYTSSPNGDSDSFTMIYSLDGNGLNANGDFLGQIAYTVRSIGGGAQEDVYLNLLVEAGGQWQVDVTGSSGQGLVRLNSLRSGADKGDITINFSGNANQNIAVELERSQGLQSDAGNFLPEEALQFYVSGGESGSISYPNPTTLDGQRVAVYSGEAIQDSLKVHLLLNNNQVSALKSGIYRGQFFVLFNLGEEIQRFPLELEIEIAPFFKIDVSYPGQGVHFDNLLPNTPPQLKEVMVKVSSNLGKPYIVNQFLADQLTNEFGDKLPKEYFTGKQEFVADSAGRLIYEDFQPLESGEQPIFYSDEQGSSAEFKMIYRLSTYPEIAAGDYTTVITFSLQER